MGLLPIQRTLAAQDAPQIFADFYRAHLTRIYRYLLFHTGTIADAEDITAQTFTAALESWDRSIGDRLAWLFGIARRKLADHYRQASRRHEGALDDAETISENSPSPEDLVSQRLQVARVAEALRGLSPDRAQAVSLHLFAGLTIREVAQVMRKDEAAVRMLVHRAIRDLRTRLAEGQENL